MGDGSGVERSGEEWRLWGNECEMGGPKDWGCERQWEPRSRDSQRVERRSGKVETAAVAEDCGQWAVGRGGVGGPGRGGER
mmetsp:Transcript_6815/g.9716  ORF Transcript_6815/g.9716 Transcript_6815/m.9716 type:complete len:81 (+) Transcript_6815:57-299(+)